MDNDSEYLVKSPKQIYAHLSHLLKKKCLLSAHFGANNNTFITTLVDIDQKNKRLILDYGPKEYLNKQLLQAGDAEFRTEFDGIKVTFSGNKINKVRIDGHAVFSMPIPDSIFWIQRRSYYRVKVPIAHDSYCEIRFLDQDNGNERLVKFKLMDISISGFSFLNERLEYSNELLPTSQFESCLLHLNCGVEETISFTVKNKANLNPSKPDKGQRVGCAFTQITPAFESNIQRYMQNIERDHLATV